ncbi:Ppx/GppA family phosphatase [Leptospira langatensis]|uniref:Ppx/GppA family phosphatase n=1 Tax=Leptospira langatensis TaxID=2484983 RepID=A0A5F1ZRM4_9LEPT|nr:Ppx/GppA phosphatase family protein [Leptospira langatensis]TGJ99000.1 Ppx/GppA family phosphatase [Leptospira langatensis]TGL40432.1 Ppx/GppA family phosphatase [Leptospira langatensis]
MVRENTLAAIDLGTNSFHMIIVRVRENGTFEAIAREKENVRLGSGLEEGGEIDPPAFKRAIDCLKRFKLLADNSKAEIRAVATSALREASNRSQFQEAAWKEAGIKIDVISGYEEARLIYFGILQGLPVFDKKILLIDIGGGSTEVLVGYRGDILFSKSFKLGAIRLTEKFLKSDPLDSSQIRKCKLYVEETILPFRKIIRDLRPEMVIGSSGTAQATAGIIRAFDGETEEIPLNHYTFTSAEFRRARNLVLEADTSKKRAKIQGFDSKRSDIIVGGILILEELFQLLDLPNMTISEFALREGIIYDTIRKWEHFQDQEHSKHLDDIRQKSIHNLLVSYTRDEDYARHVAKLSLDIFDQLAPVHKLGKEEREYLEASSLLHEVGLFISHSAYHKHSYYLIRNSEAMLGFTWGEIELIALTARYHRKSSPKSKHREFQRIGGREQDIVQKLSGILRIASACNRNRQGLIETVKCQVRKNQAIFSLVTNQNYDKSLELWACEEQADAFESAYGFVPIFQ